MQLIHKNDVRFKIAFLNKRLLQVDLDLIACTALPPKERHMLSCIAKTFLLAVLSMFQYTAIAQSMSKADQDFIDKCVDNMIQAERKSGGAVLVSMIQTWRDGDCMTELKNKKSSVVRVGSTSANQDYKNAEIAFQNKEYEKASILYKKAADNGLADAQFMLGYMYTTGWGVIQNNTEGIRWYRLAAEQGLNKAQYNLATIYNEGKIVTRNNAEAMRIFKMAAAKNHAPALRSIGVMYYNGTGVPKNRVEAFNYFLEAAQLGNSDAQLDVAELYAWGGLGYLDNHRAFMWGSIALAGGNKGAQRVLDTAKGRLEGDLKEANQLISECVDSNYKQCGNKKSQLNLDLKSTLLNLNDIAYSNAVGWNFPKELTKRLAYCIGILDFSGTTSDTPTGKGAVGKVANRARDKATNSGLTIEDGKVSFNAGFNDAKKIFESEWDRGRKAGAVDAFEMERGARQAKVEMQRVVQNCSFFISNFNATGK